jgi:anti-sigma B factor antagonist
VTNDVFFEVAQSGEADVPVLDVRGEIDVASAPELQDTLAGVIRTTPRILVVNLAEVTFIDSSGLGVLIGAVKAMRASGGDLRLVVTQPHIIRLLELTGLEEVFTVVSRTSDAVRT